MELRHNLVKEKGLLQIFLPEKIDNNNITEFEEEITNLLKNNKHDRLILEASELKYISSIGIRALMKLKKTGVDLEIIRINPQVEEILSHLGIDTIIPIFNQDKVIYTKNLKSLRESRDYIIYELEDGKDVKILKNNLERNNILHEKRSIQEAFLLGVPTIVPYDYIKTMNGKYGLVFESPIATSYETLLINDPQKADELIDKMIKIVKENQTIDASSFASNINNRKKDLKNLVDTGFIDEELYKAIENYLSLLPASENLVIPNIDFQNLVQTDNGETLFLHIDDISYGHPYLSLYRLYYLHYLLPELLPEDYENYLKLSIDDGKRYTDKFIKKYFKLEDNNEVKLEEIYKHLRILSLVSFLENISKKEKKDEDLINKVKDELKKSLNDQELNF